jgi:hypothetical protein
MGEAVAQCPTLPQNYSWTTADDYAKDEDLVKKTLVWLCNTPLGMEVQQRSAANAFVLEWLAGSPTVMLDVKAAGMPFIDQHPELLFPLIHGMALYSMLHPKEKDAITLHTEGLKVAAKLARQSKELNKSGVVKRLLRKADSGKLKEYCAELLAD